MRRARSRYPQHPDEHGNFVRGRLETDGSWTPQPCHCAVCLQSGRPALEFPDVDAGVAHELAALSARRGTSANLKVTNAINGKKSNDKKSNNKKSNGKANDDVKGNVKKSNTKRNWNTKKTLNQSDRRVAGFRRKMANGYKACDWVNKMNCPNPNQCHYYTWVEIEAAITKTPLCDKLDRWFVKHTDVIPISFAGSVFWYVPYVAIERRIQIQRTLRSMGSAADRLELHCLMAPIAKCLA